MKLFMIKVYLIFLIVGSGGNITAFAQGMMEQGHQPMVQETGEKKPSPQTTAGVPAEAKVAATPAALAPVMEIKRLESEKLLYSFELRDVEIGDLFRVLAHDYKLNLLIDKEVQGKITASLTNISLEEALETIAESQNLILEKKGNIIKVRPNLITQAFVLKYIEAKKLLETSGGAGAGQEVAAGVTPKEGVGAQAMPSGAQAAPSGAGAQATTAKQANTIYDFLSEKGKVLLGKQPNSIMVIDYPPNIKKIEEYLKVIDQKMTQRVFKLKYLKAKDVVGEAVTTTATTAGAAATATTAGTTTGAAATESTGGGAS